MRALPRLLLLLGILPLAACSSKGGDEAADSGGTAETGDDGTVPMGAPAANIAIAKVTINQGVEVALFADGSNVSTLNTGLVEGRHALVRVYVEALQGWSPRDIQGVLTLEGDQGTKVYEDIASLSGLSTEADLGSTLSFEIPPEDLQGEQSMSVALFEVEGAMFDGDSSRSTWPSEGSYTASFEAVGPLRITLVPIQYDADGSGRVPDVSEAQVQIYHDLFLGMFPLSEVELTVTEPYPWGSAIQATGGGWQQLLSAMVNLRGALGLGNDEYIYGVFAPADNLGDFCGFGCVAGLSLLAMSPSDAMGRSSIGLGFTGQESALTMAHEVGHAHGREHAPCGLLGQPSDPGYPYADAVLGVWGWDGVTGTLKDPNSNTDIMAYCMPNWLSDYTYDALLERSQAVNVAGMGDGPELLEWSSAWVDEHGNVTELLAPRMLPQPPADAAGRSVRFLDAGGQLVGEAQAHYYPLDHLPGGLVMWRPIELQSFAAVELAAP